MTSALLYCLRGSEGLLFWQQLFPRSLITGSLVSGKIALLGKTLDKDWPKVTPSTSSIGPLARTSGRSGATTSILWNGQIKAGSARA